MGNFCEHGNCILEAARTSSAADEVLDDERGPSSSAKPSLEDRREWEHILRQSYERRRQLGGSADVDHAAPIVQQCG